MTVSTRLRHQFEEFRELGFAGSAFRIVWESRVRSGLVALGERVTPTDFLPPSRWEQSIPFGNEGPAQGVLESRVSRDARDALMSTAERASAGVILAFGRTYLDFGSPPRWQADPTTKRQWDAGAHWSRAMRSAPRGADVKVPWEIGRFPHAYHMARAAVVAPEQGPRMKTALAAQFRAFVSENPIGRGVHWASGQEIAFRMLAWAFATRVLFSGETDGIHRDVVAGALLDGGRHIAHHVEYARRAVHNNHILAEALSLYVAACLFPTFPDAPHWRRVGLDLLEEQVPRQFYADGGYIQLSHNYHRLALQVLLAAVSFARASGDSIPVAWTNAMSRSLDFLVAQQNPGNGRLPNFGANDGALPLLLSTCDFCDFRPTLQAVSVLTRGERIYPPGPWDEELAWWLGAEGLSAPLRQPGRASTSFADTGFHVLRGKREASFGVLRCGSVKDRFGQIDMLHLDVWWNGENVLCDAGSYRYNGAPEWHEHFMRTASHNTVRVDDRDQMLHFRQFKLLYPTRARVLRFEDAEEWGFCEGEHLGYSWGDHKVVHRRSVLFVKDHAWVVADHLIGSGSHSFDLHWLCSAQRFATADGATRLDLCAGSEELSLRVYSALGIPMPQNVVSGQDEPPRGWLSRYYHDKQPTPSSVTRTVAQCPTAFVSILSPRDASVAVDGRTWTLRIGATVARFLLGEDRLDSLSISRGSA